MDSIYPKCRLSTLILSAMLMLAGSSAMATTSTWAGDKAATVTGSPFIEVTGNVITVTAASSPTYINTGSGAQQLLGISGLWIVSPSGGNDSVVKDVTNGSVITGPGNAKTTWVSESSPAGYAGATGFASNGNWITLASSSTLSKFGETASKYNEGIFTFYGLAPATNLEVGVDYLVADGSTCQTETAYFNVSTGLSAVPEPNSLTILLIGMAAGAGLIAVRSKQRANTQIL